MQSQVGQGSVLSTGMGLSYASAMRIIVLSLAYLLPLVVAGCSDGGGDGGVASLLGDLPSGRNFTGQGEMGVGVMGNSEGESGPSQVDEPDWGHGRNAIK